MKNKKLPDNPAQQASSSRILEASGSTVAPKQSLPSHRNREPRVKPMPLPVSKDTSNFTETKRRIAERAGALQSVVDVDAITKKPVLAGLSFKKNRSTSDAAGKQSHVAPGSSPTEVRRASGSLSFPDSQNGQIVESPVSAGGGGWGRSQSPGGPATTWGASSSSAWGVSAGWGTESRTPQEKHFVSTGLLSPSVENQSS